MGVACYIYEKLWKCCCLLINYMMCCYTYSSCSTLNKHPSSVMVWTHGKCFTIVHRGQNSCELTHLKANQVILTCLRTTTCTTTPWAALPSGSSSLHFFFRTGEEAAHFRQAYFSFQLHTTVHTASFHPFRCTHANTLYFTFAPKMPTQTVTSQCWKLAN